MLKRIVLALVIVGCFFLSSCSVSDSNPYKIKPKAFGVMNEIVVLTDDVIWDSAVGDTVLYYFGGAYPLTPRPEPIFDLRQFEVRDLNSQSLKKELRTYMILCDLSDENSETTQFVKKDLGEEGFLRASTDPNFQTSVGRDKWATGQILIYVFANSLGQLAEAIRGNYNSIAAKVNQHDSKQLYQSTYAKGENKGLSAELFETYGVVVKIPRSFIVVREEPDDHNMTWLKYDYRNGAINLVFRKYKYESNNQVSKNYIKTEFNDFGRKYVSSPEKGSFVLVNDIDLPILEFTREISGHYTKEFRGIWEMENDFMGGPFMSYAIIHEDKGELLLVDAFVYAPGKRKRNVMQELDLIVKGINW